MSGSPASSARTSAAASSGGQSARSLPASAAAISAGSMPCCGVSSAPCLVVLLSSPEAYLDRYAEPDKGRTDRDAATWPVPWWDVDTGMAALLALLTAADEGLGALLLGVPGHSWDAVRAAFGIPPDRRLLGVVALGYAVARPPGGSARRPRRPLSEVVHDGRFGVPWDGPAAR